jgi:N utilization substance protein B
MQNDLKKNQPPHGNNGFNPTARRNARRYALQAMYQWHIAHTPVTEIEAEFLLFHIDKKLDMDYFKELIHGIPEHTLEINQAMEPFLGRPLEEIDPVELAVLRVAIYELIKRPDIPYRVIINEALELTKKFGSIEGHKFINGMLDRVAKEIRKTEVKMNK